MKRMIALLLTLAVVSPVFLMGTLGCNGATPLSPACGNLANQLVELQASLEQAVDDNDAEKVQQLACDFADIIDQIEANSCSDLPQETLDLRDQIEAEIDCP